MRKLLASIILLIIFATPLSAYIKPVNNGPHVDTPDKIVTIMSAKTSTGDGDVFAVSPSLRTIDAKVVGTGAVTATVIIYVSNTGASDDWITAGTITLSGTTSDVDGFAMSAKWAYMKANLSAISGTGAAVTVTMGV